MKLKACIAFTAIVAIAVWGMQNCNAGYKLAKVSDEEAQKINGGDCPIVVYLGMGCGEHPWSWKFWQSCSDIAIYDIQSDLPGKYQPVAVQCLTGCGTGCGYAAPLIECDPPPA